MIVDCLPNFAHYLAVHPLFRLVSEFVDGHRIEELEIGRIGIGNGIKAIVDEYDTKSRGDEFLECHKKYVDIHIVLSGVEEIGYCNRLLCDVRENYNEQNDVEKLSGEMAFVTLRKNGFAVFFPQDAHMPGLRSNGHMNRTKKIVFKVPCR